MRLLLLCGLLAAATAAPVITASNEGQFITLRPDGERLQHTPCEYCQDVVRTLDEFMSDPQTQKTVSDFLDATVCATLPSNFGEMCKQEVPVLVAAAAIEIASALTPYDVCGVVGVCTSAPSLVQRLGLQAQQGVSSPFDCPFCKMAVVTFIQRIQDPEKRAEIEGVMRAACTNLDAEAQARCQRDVTNLFQALDDLLHDVDPEGVCEVAEFCAPDEREHTEAQEQLQGGAAAALAAARGSGRGAAKALGGAVRFLATGGPAAAVAGGASNDMCDSCKAIVAEAAAILQDPKTQAELLEYAKEGCSVFEDFKDQCEAYVTLYGPLVFNMVISYLQPDSICTTMGYCTAHPVPLVAA